MKKQLEIEFSHPRENTRESEQHYFDNFEKFSKQARFVLEKLRAGEILTTLMAVEQYRIIDLRARISELRRKGINVEDEFVKDAEGKLTRFKKYFIKKQIPNGEA